MAKRILFSIVTLLALAALAFASLGMMTTEKTFALGTYIDPHG